MTSYSPSANQLTVTIQSEDWMSFPPWKSASANAYSVLIAVIESISKITALRAVYTLLMLALALFRG